MTQRVIKRICSKGYGLWLNGTRGPVDASTSRHTTPTPTRAGEKDESARGRESEPVSLETDRLARVRGFSTLESSSSVCICPFVDASRSVKTVAATRSSGVAVTTDRNGTKT